MTTAADLTTDLTGFLARYGAPQMHSYYTFIALDLARERVREANQWRLADAARTPRDGSLRRTVAVALAGVGRLVAGTVRRLDDCVADDFAESLVTGH
jgi:hypothetical protein